MSEDRTMYGHPQYPAFLRRRADHVGSDLADAQAMDDLAAELRGHKNAALVDSRNHYGFPMAPSSAPVDDYDDWTPQDISARDDLARRTHRALSHAFTKSEANWAAEEVLAQIGFALAANGEVHIPRVCTLRLCAGVLSVQAAPGLDLTRGGLGNE